MTGEPVTNEASVSVRKGPLVGPVLGRVVGMLAARAQCPIDRLDDAMLLTDAVAAHAPTHTTDAHVKVVVAADERGIELRIGSLSRDGARGLLDDAELPGVGNVFKRVADEVDAKPPGDGPGELVLRLRFATA
jgi:serine/threonine-protein kinase RsbW